MAEVLPITSGSHRSIFSPLYTKAYPVEWTEIVRIVFLLRHPERQKKQHLTLSM